MPNGIIGNLDENGYLTATLDEMAAFGNYSMDDVEEALAMVQEFDPPGVGARDLQECLLLQLKLVDPQNTLAQQIIAEHLKLLQNNQLKEVARALNRPVELVKRAVDVIKRLDPKPGLRYNNTEPRLVEPDVQFRKVDGEWQALMNEDDLPQLRLNPTVPAPAGARCGRPRRAQLRERAFHRRDPADEKYRAAQTHHSARLPIHFAAARRFPGLWRRPFEADDDQGSGGGSGRASFHRQPRRGE